MTVARTQRQHDTVEDSLTWAAVYLVPGQPATTANADGPPLASSHAQRLNGSLSDTPHALPNNGSQETGTRYFIFRNLAISDPGVYKLQVCIFEMVSDDSSDIPGSARHIQSVLTREIVVTRMTHESPVGT